jgi:hypothetical protein
MGWWSQCTIILPHPPHDFDKFYCSIFMQVCKVHQPYSPSFTLFTYPPPLTSTLPLTGPVLHPCPSLFCHGISLVNTVYCNMINPFYYCPLPFPHSPIIQWRSVCFITHLLTQMQCILVTSNFDAVAPNLLEATGQHEFCFLFAPITNVGCQDWSLNLLCVSTSGFPQVMVSFDTLIWLGRMCFLVLFWQT